MTSIFLSRSGPDILFLNHDCSILRQSSNPVCGFSMMGQVRPCAVWPMENWLGSSLNWIQAWITLRESYSRALEQGPLVWARRRLAYQNAQLVQVIYLLCNYKLQILYNPSVFLFIDKYSLFAHFYPNESLCKERPCNVISRTAHTFLREFAIHWRQDKVAQNTVYAM